MGEFVMPSLGADMEDGILVEWEKKPGDAIRRGDVVAVVETQKGAIEIEAFEDGVLASYMVDVGTLVPVGTPLAIIQTKDAAGANDGPQAVVSTQPAAESRAAAPRIRATPAARKLAAESGIDLASIGRTGPDQAVTLDDVLAHQGKRSSVQAAATVTTDMAQPSGMRSAIAASMARSKREIPHYYLSQTIDITDLEAYLTEANADRPPTERLLVGAVYLKAVAQAAAKYAEFNGHYIDGVFKPNQSVHPGMAISVRGGGLVAPAIHDVPSLDLNTVMSKMRDLVTRVRAGRFRSAEVADPTITVSSLGERGVDSLFGVIHPPQVAIVGFGASSLRPWVCNGNLAARRTVTITLAADHRVSDGHRGALFLRAVQAYLNTPEALS